jgi:hypothetical protein
MAGYLIKVSDILPSDFLKWYSTCLSVKNLRPWDAEQNNEG